MTINSGENDATCRSVFTPRGTHHVDVIVFNQRGGALTIDVNTLTSEREWLVDPFIVREHHFAVFVDFLNAKRGAELGADVFVVASERLREFVSRERVTRVPIDELDKVLHIRNAWQPVLAEAAA